MDFDREPKITEPGFLKTYWRPMMAWQYFIVCICDFIIFPIITLWWSSKTGQQWNWQPITLKEGGFYHMAMGVIIGVAAWQRGEEKLWKTKIFGPEMVERERSILRNEESEQMYIDEDDIQDITDEPPAHPSPYPDHSNHHRS